ncbi:aerotaxis receptor Aer [Bowmanella sp. JS7-9]|nr:aerotaxis receptor Aer [Bowmanella sp. JS7-9]
MKVAPNSREITFDRQELIVSKTDLRGKLTYANRVFMRVSNFSEADLLGKDHSIIRHPDMPRGVFYGLWKALKSGQEFFGFVKNITSDGHYYWVFANITPDVVNGEKVGFFSVRRTAPKGALQVIEDIYRQMRDKEKGFPPAQAPEASWNWMVQNVLETRNQSYEQFVIELYQEHSQGGAR